MNIVRSVFIVFLAAAFAAGGYVYSSVDIPGQIERMEGIDESKESDKAGDKDAEKAASCPDLLVQRGQLLYLYDTQKEEKAGENPLVFNNLDEYAAHVDSQGAGCPILFLQQENGAQGRDVFRAKNLQIQSQTPLTDGLRKPNKPRIIHVADASRDNGYNQNMHAGFDPYGQNVGQYTNIDQIHDSTAVPKQSDNPMDVNWGGVLFTQYSVDSGKYEENNIVPTNYSTPKGGQFLPIPNSGIPPMPTTNPFHPVSGRAPVKK